MFQEFIVLNKGAFVFIAVCVVALMGGALAAHLPTGSIPATTSVILWATVIAALAVRIAGETPHD